ncbi:MAG: TetR/AcrR family transcriptional regulator [Ruminococcaceae bacterium]|nr:TetR/AcrR family transcriptional regulator [Oscillospiraceae bacterium]
MATEVMTVRKQIVLSAAKLFMRQGFTNTSVKEISVESGVSENAIYYEMKTKENILTELIGHVLAKQKLDAIEIVGDITDDRLLLYATEKVLQLHLAESSEQMRELYTMVYSIPKAWDIIKQSNAIRLKNVFGKSHPELALSDFYELEIAAGGIVRGYLSTPCDMYFTMDHKVSRLITSIFKVFDVSEEEISKTLEFISQFDFDELAQDTLNSLPEYFQEKVK